MGSTVTITAANLSDDVRGVSIFTSFSVLRLSLRRVLQLYPSKPVQKLTLKAQGLHSWLLFTELPRETV
jgi:hypothetical protein